MNGPESNWGHPVAYHPLLANFFENVNSAIFFCQLRYWSERTENPLGVYKTAEEWTAETGLSYREQVTARRVLTDRGFVTETNKRLEHKLFFKVDWDVFNKSFSAWTDIKNGISKAHFPNCAKRIPPNDENAVRGVLNRRSSIDTETTAETTTERAAGKPAAPAKPSRVSRGDKTLKTYLAECSAAESKAIPDDHYVRGYMRDAGITDDMAAIAWLRFKEDHTVGTRKAKRYVDWPAVFANSVKDRWYKLWMVNVEGDANWTNEGIQARRVTEARQGGEA